MHVSDNGMRNNATDMRCLAKFMVSQNSANKDLAAPDIFYFFSVKLIKNQPMSSFLNSETSYPSFQSGRRVTFNNIYNDELHSKSQPWSKSFDYNVNLFSDSIFIEKNVGLLPVIDKHFAQQQEAGLVFKHHNTLPSEDLVKTLDHPIWDPKNAVGYVYLYIK